ncbi:MAG TPA: P-loop NTPase fold protein, partial [Blastocatellia bacterium]|nr:P-loop NTPase fold protein [Blastocatellia bacterium]
MEAEKDLLDVISCKARGHDSEFLGIATIITPSFAVIPNVTLPSPESPEPTLFLNFEQLPEYYTAQAFMAAHDSELNVSLLKLDPPVPFDLSSLRFADTPTLFTLGAEWRTLGFEGDTVTAPHVKGRIGEPDTLTEGSKQIRLDPYPDTVGQAGAGAPVLIEDRLIGVVTATDEATGVIYAIPFSEIVKSESFAEVRKLIAKQDADSPDPPVETGPAAKTGAPPQKRRKLIPGFSSDDAKGEDKLDIKREVEALCSVIAAKDVEPPVSVGLFGDWGSGKSFFMRKMEENINTLKTQARANPKSPYCPNIVQLWFNAWHYMDTDLWASLASEIFEGLAEQLAREAQPKSEQDPSYKRARLVADRASSLSKLEQAEKELRQVEAQLSQNVQSLARLGEEIAPDTSPQALLREGLQFALRQPEVIDQIAQGRREFETKMREAAKQLNVPAPELFELRGVAGRLRAVKLALTNTRNLKKWLVAVGSLFVFAVAALLLSQWSLGLSDRLSRIIAAATGLLGFLSPFIYSGLRAINLIKD